MTITLTKRKDQTTTIRGLTDSDLRLLVQCLDCHADKSMKDADLSMQDGFRSMAEQQRQHAGMVARLRDAFNWMTDRYDSGELELIGGGSDPTMSYIVNNRRTA